jgi:hypothetical protein
MAQSDELSRPPTSGDAAVDGLLAGAGAGVLMAVYLAGAGLAAGEPVGVMLGRFDPGGTGAAVTGALAHLATAAVYGVLFGLAWHAVRRWRRGLPGWLAGLAYGVALLALANGVFLPLTNPALAEIPPVHLWAAHLAYGLVLGMLVGRRRTS